MKVIIPVAGEGTRLRPHTLMIPKVMLNVAGHPMIYYIVKELINKRIGNEIIFITGYKANALESYLNSEFGRNFTYVRQEKMLGLGHAIYCAKNVFKGKKNEDILIILGDTLFDVNLKSFISSSYGVIGVKKVEDPRRFGVVETDSNGFITRFVEKPANHKISPSNEAIVGLYYIKNSKTLFNSLSHIINNGIKTKNEFQLTDALEHMLTKNEKMKTFEVQGWLDCGKQETILETNKYLLRKNNKKYAIKGIKVIPPVFIGKRVRISYSIIGPYATINDDCNIEGSIIENSIIYSNSKIRNSSIKDSVIGNHTRVIGAKGTLNLGDFSEVAE